MATISATQDGDWSDPSTWSGGVIPGPGDIAQANGCQVTIDQDITVDTLTQNSYSNAYKGFSISGQTGRVINANITTTGVKCLTIHDSTGVVINGNITGGTKPQVTPATYNEAVSLSGTVSLTVNGDVSAGSGAAGWSSAIRNIQAIPSYLTIVINGNVTGGASSAAIHMHYTYALFLTIHGDVVAGTGLTGDTACGVYCMNNTSGNVSNQPYVLIDGDVYGGDSQAGIYSWNIAVIFNGTMLYTGQNRYYRWSIQAPSILGLTGENIVLKTKQVSAAALASIGYNIFGPNLDLGFVTDPGEPPEPEPPVVNVFPADVRKGVEYGDLVGTLAVPTPEQVAFGIPVDNTVGNAAISLTQLSTITGGQIAAAFEK